MLSGTGLALSNLTWLGQGLFLLTLWHETSMAKRFAHWLTLVPSTGRAQVASPRSHTSHSTLLRLRSTPLLLIISV